MIISYLTEIDSSVNDSVFQCHAISRSRDGVFSCTAATLIKCLQLVQETGSIQASNKKLETFLMSKSCETVDSWLLTLYFIMLSVC